jgi:hypothetical protein
VSAGEDDFCGREYNSSGVYICKTIVHDLRHGNYICKSEGIYLPIVSGRGRFLWKRGRSLVSRICTINNTLEYLIIQKINIKEKYT